MPVTDADGRTLWLADHLLVSERGHHVSYNGFIADAARRAGLRVRILCARNFEAEVPGGFRMDGIFRADWRSNPPTWIAKSRRALDALEWLARLRFRADLRMGFPASTAGPRDIVFAEMLAPRNLAGWLHWLAAIPAGSGPMLVLHLGYASERFGADPELPGLLAALKLSEKSSAPAS